MTTPPAEPDPVLAVCGPTAAGKTTLARRVAHRLAEHGVAVEVVCCDSMQVYRRMDIGTAKPDTGERAALAHHCIDLVEPWEPYSAADYQRDARQAFAAVRARGAVPLVVGGTGLYLRAALDDVDLVAAGPPDPELRERLEATTHADLVEELVRLDPRRAARTDLANPRRVTRAVEIALTRGPGLEPDASWVRRRGATPVALAVVAPAERADLYARIDARIDSMLAAGWLDEVHALVRDPRGMSRTAAGAIGYAELAEVVSAGVGLDEAVTAIRRRTRGYARRQTTWFRREPRAVHHSGHPDELAAALAAQFERATGVCTSTS